MTDSKERRPYGLWPSPLTPQRMGQSLRLGDVGWDSDGETLVWLEGRSDRSVLVVAGPGDDAPRDLSGELSVRGGIGYGGGEFCVAGGAVYFCERGGRIYRQPLGRGQARALTPGFGSAASPEVSPDGRWLVYVHTYEQSDRLAIVDTQGQRWPQQLASGADFYMQPRWHPHGTALAWISWNHPLMPWDGSELHLGTLSVEGELPRIVESHLVAGDADTAIFQPEFSPDGRYLAYISDAGGWSNLYLYDLQSKTSRQLTDERADLGVAAWVQGLRTYGFSADGGAIYVLRNSAGSRQLWRYDLASGAFAPYASALDRYSWLQQIALAPSGSRLALVASAADIPDRIVSLELGQASRARVRARSDGETSPPEDYARPQAVQWASAGGTQVHGLYYPPTSSRYSDDGLPPALLYLHGGPTSQASAKYSADLQFFTSRGYAVLAVNYRGSTGYGRDYMLAQRGQWGVVDVEDTLSGAHYLAEAGLADGRRLALMGGSAGGYTILQTLVRQPGLFRAALCLFGISNQFTAIETHKFEERYNDMLLGVLPQAREIYYERSPIFAVERISDPIALFHGTEDNVVPIDQSETIARILKQRGIPHEYHVYEGEGHGFRKSATLKAYYAAAEAFLKKHVIYG